MTAKQPFVNGLERGPDPSAQEPALRNARSVELPSSGPRVGWQGRWFYPYPPTFRRTLLGIVLSVAAVGLSVGLSAVIEPDDPAALFLLIGPLAIGLYIRARTAVWAVYVGVVIPYVVNEVARYVYLGGAEWEQRNLEHWQGDASALSKLAGQLVEYAVFGIFFALLAGLGALLGHGLESWWRRRDGRRHAAR